MTNKKQRLDQLLVEKKLVTGRAQAKALIMAGQVFADGVKIEKAGTSINSTANIEIKGETLPFVSRGGLKLVKALQEFKLDLKGKIVLDIGASTGGFTDCVLQNGAQKVYAVDVGYGQLAWTLRQDQRVIVLERKNARYLSFKDIPEEVDLITIDVSFISARKILPVVKKFLKESGLILFLLKPQFEVGRQQVGKKGVVRDPHIHCQVIRDLIEFNESINLKLQGLTFSPLQGPRGNLEFWLALQKNGVVENWFSHGKTELINQVVREGHRYFKGGENV